jgi:hypothetical protein
MGRENIARERFRWKQNSPWLKAEIIRAIWITSQDGKLSYEFELVSTTGAPVEEAKKLKNNRLPLKDQTIIDLIEAKLPDFDVCGASGRGIIVGEMEIPINEKRIKVLIQTTLKDWRDWLEHKRFFKTQKK